MDFQIFLNQNIINKNGELGIVSSIDGNNVVVQYEEVFKTYNTIIAFSKYFLKFVIDIVQNQIELYLNEVKKKQNILEEQIKDNNAKAIEKNKKFEEGLDKKIMERYKELWHKDYKMKQLFGQDFKYPPLRRLQRIIDEKALYEQKYADERFYNYSRKGNR